MVREPKTMSYEVGSKKKKSPHERRKASPKSIIWKILLCFTGPELGWWLHKHRCKHRDVVKESDLKVGEPVYFMTETLKESPLNSLIRCHPIELSAMVEMFHIFNV